MIDYTENWIFLAQGKYINGLKPANTKSESG